MDSSTDSQRRQVVEYHTSPTTHSSGVRKLEAEEEADCPLCGLRVLSALKARQKPAVIVRPGWMRCSCRGEQEWHVATELEKLEDPDRPDPLTREARECFWEEANRPHEPASESKGKNRERGEKAEIRLEQEHQGFVYADPVETEKLEQLREPIKGKVPQALKKNLIKEASKHGQYRVNRTFRWLMSKHLRQLDAAWEVKPDPSNEMLEVLITKEWLVLWEAVKRGLQDQNPGYQISDADLMAAVMLREWA